ncbi:unnamed protein product, partial [Heligmosomoides polygyrus]|uniref:PIPK domain-containing protein n=1 Tax=Heligmosomoides polygyrus TaxID=6339 RepID=A0A183GM94_HELPZ
FVGNFFISRRNSKRARHEEDGEWTGNESASGGPSHSVGRAGKALKYTYISQEEEQQILQSAHGSVSTYAQKLAKVLFADTLELYFKVSFYDHNSRQHRLGGIYTVFDQDPGKRQWIHEAVDFRFPSRDKNSQHMKWKNCSTAINKNMRQIQRAPLEKPPQKKSERFLHSFVRLYLPLADVIEAVRRLVAQRSLNRDELASRSSDGNTLFQDTKLKDWLRECVDRRFHLQDKARRDHRWKICAAACNRNRSKVLGEDGKCKLDVWRILKKLTGTNRHPFGVTRLSNNSCPKIFKVL